MVDQVKEFSGTPLFLKEKRLFDRFPAQFPAKFKDTRDDFGANVRLRNVCAQGARITTTEHNYLNDSVALEVELTDGRGPMVLRGAVTWTKEIDVGIWDVGIQFHKVVLMDLWRIYKSAEENSST